MLSIVYLYIDIYCLFVLSFIWLIKETANYIGSFNERQKTSPMQNQKVHVDCACLFPTNYITYFVLSTISDIHTGLFSMYQYELLLYQLTIAFLLPHNVKLIYYGTYGYFKTYSPFATNTLTTLVLCVCILASLLPSLVICFLIIGVRNIHKIFLVILNI